MTHLRVRTDALNLANEPPPVRAFGREGQILSRLWARAGQAASLPITRRHDDVADRFASLAAEWRERCMLSSSTTDLILDEAYQRIIGLGEAVVPVLLAELRDGPDHWMWALQAITGADPVAPEDRGDLIKMAGAWVRWGRAKGYRV